jgi:hypothetical protein
MDPRRRLPRLALLLTLILGPALAMAGDSDVSPDVLDELERTICVSSSNWTNALEEQAKRQSVSIEAVSGQKIDDPARREYLQQRLDAALTASQKKLTAELRRQYLESQQRYGKLVGHEFDLSRCGQTAYREQRRQAWEKEQQEAAMQQQADRLAGSEASMLGAACRDLEIMKGPPAEARAAFTERDIELLQGKAKENIERLFRSYEKRTGKRFDPARCQGR